MTGVSRGDRSSTQLVPPAPMAVVEGVGTDLLGIARRSTSSSSSTVRPPDAGATPAA